MIDLTRTTIDEERIVTRIEAEMSNADARGLHMIRIGGRMIRTVLPTILKRIVNAVIIILEPQVKNRTRDLGTTATTAREIAIKRTKTATEGIVSTEIVIIRIVAAIIALKNKRENNQFTEET